MAEKPRVVFDCNVLLQAAARQESAAASCLSLVEQGLIQLFVSKEVLSEIEDVLNRPEVRACFPDLSDEIAGAFVARLRSSAISYPTFRRHSATLVMQMMKLT